MLRQMEHLVKAGLGAKAQQQRGGSAGRATIPEADAYGLLGVSKTADKDEVKRAYRKLMSQHHPDKLVSKGLPPEMIKVATEKTQQIKAAYEQIKEAKGWK